MRRLQPFGVLILLGALCFSMAAPGCKKGEDKGTPPKGDPDQTQGDDGGKGNVKTKLTALEGKTYGTITGTVTYDGDPPTAGKLPITAEHEKNCTMGASPEELVNQTWLVNPKNKGVSDVIIYLKAPEGKFLKVHDSYLSKKKDSKELDQPHCAFVPHSFYVWAAYRDNDGKLKATEQEVLVKNKAKFKHNIVWEGGPVQGKGDNIMLNEEESKPYKFKADLANPILFKCGIHPWMNANCWALDTPYAARTDADGKFTIENAPLDVELYVVGWHEDTANKGFFHGGKGGTKTTLKEGKPLDLKIKRG
jgi:hypothetical protein